MQFNQQPTLRELLSQFVNILKHSFDKSNQYHNNVISTELANATLSQFEKTYVSFPEFIDTTTETAAAQQIYNTTTTTTTTNSRPPNTERWYQPDTLAC